MKRIALMWILPVLLLAAPAAWGQETDSLFFRPDSLQSASPGRESGSRAIVVRQWAAAEPFMTARIQFTSDFIRRFNNQMDSSPSVTTGQTTCAWRIRALFDAEDDRLGRRSTGAKSTYAATVEDFIGEVCGANTARLLINPNENLYAAVQAWVTGQQHEQPLTLYLKKTRTGPDWAWTIIGADAPFLDAVGVDTSYLLTNRRDSLVFIAPNAHELNFMGLAKQLRAGHALGTFVSPAAIHDARLTALGRQFATGQLRLQTIQTTTLWLNTQWGGWLQLRFFNRETDNAGWLISDLCPVGGGECLPPVLRRFMNDTVFVTKP